MSGNETEITTRRPLWKRVADWGMVAFLVVMAVLQILIRNWDSPWGLSANFVATYLQILLTAVVVTIWWLWISPFAARVRYGTAAVCLLLLLAWGASIRTFTFSGDTELTIVYRWDPVFVPRINLQTPQPEADNKVAAIPTVPVATVEDMPAFRGQHRDGIVACPPLAIDWSANPPRELWRRGCGGGYGALAVVDTLAVSLEQRDADEAVVCYDANSGAELWVSRYPASFFEALGGPGPRSTPTIDKDRVYSFGAFGDLCCFDLLTGKQQWHVNSLQEFAVPNTVWAMTSSPLIVNDTVIVNVGGLQGNGLAAYNKLSGQLQWQGTGLQAAESVSQFKTGAEAVTAGGNSVPGYCSPMLATLHGQEQILNFDGMALRGHDPATGKQLWEVEHIAGDHVSVAQPIVFADGRIFISTSYTKGSRMLQVERNGDDWTTKELWSNLHLRCKFSSPVIYDNQLYGLDEGVMVSLNPATGKRNWKGGKSIVNARYGHGQMLLIHDQILLLAESGKLILIEASPESLKEVATLQVLVDNKTWNTPAISRRRLYVRNTTEVACYELPVVDSLVQRR